MGTRSFVAEPHGDTWRGRYCHWDGYPTGKGPTLFAMVRRDGVETVRQRLLHDRYGWSSLHADQKDEPLSLGYQDGRFACEPGYGIAYTTERGQSDPDEWISPESGDWGTEWGYILGDAALFVFKVDGWGNDKIQVTHLATVPYTDDPDWEAIEKLGWPDEDDE